MLGNDCQIDCKGFLHPTDRLLNLEQSHLYKRMIGSPRYFNNKIANLNCWVCERWVEMKIEWRSPVAGMWDTEPIFAHLECDEFAPELMTREADGSFSLTRALPPGEFRLFFSHYTSQFVSSAFRSTEIDPPLTKRMRFWAGCEYEVQVSVVNVASAQGNKLNLRSPFRTRPRVPGKEYVPPEGEL